MVGALEVGPLSLTSGLGGVIGVVSSACNVLVTVFTDNAARWSGIEREKQRTENRHLRDSKFGCV